MVHYHGCSASLNEIPCSICFATHCFRRGDSFEFGEFQALVLLVSSFRNSSRHVGELLNSSTCAIPHVSFDFGFINTFGMRRSLCDCVCDRFDISFIIMFTSMTKSFHEVVVHHFGSYICKHEGHILVCCHTGNCAT